MNVAADVQVGHWRCFGAVVWLGASAGFGLLPERIIGTEAAPCKRPSRSIFARRLISEEVA